MIPIGEKEDMLFGPYNAEIMLDDMGQPIFDVLGIPEVDRQYDSTDYALFQRQVISNGVFPNPLVFPPTGANSAGLQIMSFNNSMVLTMRTGAAFVEGRYYIAPVEFTFPVPQAHLTLGRRDIVVIRHDVVARTCQPFLIPGTPSATPQPPALVRTDDVWDLQLCMITVNPNAHQITQANIQDTRPNNNVCGFVTGLVHAVDTRTLFAQMQADLNEQVAFFNQQRAAWQTQQNNWIAQQNQWTAEQRQLFETLGREIRELIIAMETGSFTLFNHNFDDWSVRRGCDYSTVFTASVITTAIRVVALNFILATRTTTFNADGTILTSITFGPWTHTEGNVTTETRQITITQRTIFNADGSIRSEVR